MRVLSACLVITCVFGAWKKESAASMAEEQTMVQLKYSSRAHKVRYGDAISLVHLTSDGRITLRGSALISTGTIASSFFRLLDREGQASKKIIRRGDKVMLQDISTGHFILTTQSENGTAIVGGDFNFKSPEVPVNNLLWGISDYNKTLGKGDPILCGQALRLRSVAANGYLHGDMPSNGILYFRTNSDEADSNSAFLVERIVMSDDIPSVPVRGRFIMEPRSFISVDKTVVRFGDIITVKSVASGLNLKASSLSESTDPAILLTTSPEAHKFRFLHRNGEAKPYEPVLARKKVVIQDLNTGKIVAIKGENHRIQFTANERVHSNARFHLVGVFDSLMTKDTPLKLGDKFMLKNPNTELFINMEADENVGFIAKTKEMIHGNNIFEISRVEEYSAPVEEPMDQSVEVKTPEQSEEAPAVEQDEALAAEQVEAPDAEVKAPVVEQVEAPVVE